LGRQGGLSMATRIPDPDEGWKVDAAQTVLPNKPFEINFVLTPTVTLDNVVINGQPERPRQSERDRPHGPLDPISDLSEEQQRAIARITRWGKIEVDTDQRDGAIGSIIGVWGGGATNADLPDLRLLPFLRRIDFTYASISSNGLENLAGLMEL